jgi:5-hydroxyisourate hydrolase-like protein (transthyretin family)
VAAVAVGAIALTGSIAAPAAAAEYTRVVSGHVYLGDATRLAAEGEVTVTASQSGGPTVSTTTDGEGGYALSVVSTSAWANVLLVFTYNGTGEFADGAYPGTPLPAYASETTSFGPSDVPGIDMTLPGPVAVGGQVVLAPTWEPAAEGSVAVSWRKRLPGANQYGPESAPQTVDGDGRYSFEMLGGEYLFRYVDVDAPGDYVEVPINVIDYPKHIWAADVELPVRTMYPRDSVSGRVGLGVSSGIYAGEGDVRVSLSRQETREGPWVRLDETATLTDGQGRFTITGMPAGGWYRVNFEWVGSPAGSYLPALDKREFFRGSSTSHIADVTWTLQGVGSIAGTAFLEDSSTPAGAGDVKVTARKDNESTVFRTAVTDADGRYRLDDLPEGFWDLEFDYLGEEPYGTTTRDALLRTPDLTDADSTLPFQESVSGHVRDSAGRPVVGAHVGLYYVAPHDSAAGRWTQTDADGRYSFADVHAEVPFELSFSADAYAAQGWPDSEFEPDSLRLERREAREDVDVTMWRAGMISGVVTAAGIPSGAFSAGQIHVQLMRYDTGARTWVPAREKSLPSSTGGYEIPDLHPGEYRVRTTYFGSRGEAVRVSPVLAVSEGANKVHSFKIRPFDRDLTGDGNPDLVIRSSVGRFYVYPGNGAGGLLPARLHPVGLAGVTAIVHAGDLTGDGRADVLTRFSGGQLRLHKGDSRGELGFPIVIGKGWNTHNVILSPGDFNGDGFTDVIGRDAAGYLWLYKGNGKGGLQARVKIASGWKGLSAIAAASDMNEDGAPDLLARDSSGTLWLYPGNGTNGFKTRVKMSLNWSSTTALVGVGDFNGDWHPDIVARDASGSVWLHPGDGTGGLKTRQRIATGWSSHSFAR